ncbi:hypothetical protein SAY86_015039 [Trapa natans]|uniref:Zinc knuckle (CCHC-type) family protein n=1 Tax=Trapa natans TaxID=22666 RepID=A0AAN7KH43_TRANT|nr:hypothetical protein SAY86_015039 [Trapa natans]
MNLEDDKIEPVADLGLSTDYSDQKNQRDALTIDPSAGANAGSGMFMTCVATSPLTELVWSPHKGLSLKCADCSFSDRKEALLWSAGPSNIAETKCSIEPLNKLNLMALKKIDDAKFDYILTHEQIDNEMTGNSEKIPEIETEDPVEISVLHNTFDEQDLRDGQSTPVFVHLKTAGTSKREENQLLILPGCDVGKTVDIPAVQQTSSSLLSNRELGIERVPTSQVHPVDEHKLSNAPILPPCKGKGKGIEKTLSGPPHLDKLESTVEKNLQASKTGNIWETGAKITLKTESAPTVKTDLVQDCDAIPGQNIISISQSLSSNRRPGKHESKDKGKALSEGDVSGKFSKEGEGDESYESVESCNSAGMLSAGMLSAGKRRWSFEQRLIIGSKRAKQIEQIPGTSSSLTKHDSSFMNWISNMTRGFARPVEATCSLGHAPSNTNPAVHENQDIHVDVDIHPLNNRSLGFMSIFQSMYCSNKSSKGMNIGFDQLGDGSAGIEPPNQEGAMATNLLTSLHKESDDKATKEDSNVISQGNEGAPSDAPKISFGNFITSQDAVRACSSGSMNTNVFEDRKGKDATKASDSSLIGQSAKKGETGHSLPSQDKRADLTYKGNSLRSLWITRFSARNPCSFKKQEVGDPSNPSACVSAQKLLDFCREQVAPVSRGRTDQESSHVIGDKDPKNFASSAENSFGFRRIEDPFLTHKVNPILPSPRLRSSEAMASVFARRLDALKSIIQSSELKDDSSRANATCFFCGRKGHHLQSCPEITELELEDLLKNIKSYDTVDGSPCLCIRCFQLNHWAVTCPNMFHKNPKCNLASSNHLVRNSNENATAKSGNLEKWQVSEVPKGIFSVIQALRLSRTDILKWLNSPISRSHLDGFFLRLRLGKWEEGLSGTGYYVACITGMRKKTWVNNAKGPISVNVGGIKCLVESQYISNHDFLEDELMAWWCTTSQSGGKIPSEEDLKMKAEEKKMLGFDAPIRPK